MNDILVEIVIQCIDLQKRVKSFYSDLAKRPQDNKLKEFWRSLVIHKESHMNYLHKVLVFTKQGIVPQIFSKPFKIYEDLQKINLKMNNILSESIKKTDLQDHFIAAYYAEFFLIHDAFTVFYRMELPKIKTSPFMEYEAHISRFVKIINNAANKNSMLDLLGEMLNRLWERTMRISEGSLKDTLTGVLNRQGFLHKVTPWLELLAREKKVFATLVIDIDNLKGINEKYNPNTGDKVIRFVTAQLDHLCRKCDVFCRYSGGEFVVFIPFIDKKMLLDIAERFRENIEKKSISKNIINDGVTVSIGGVYGKIKTRDVMSQLDQFIDSASTLLLHKVKKNGGNGCAILRLE
ncbi:MAG: GGDEF domain-containing protein [Candidatus Aureabacteria bacterium]|nr:GGDEF domain-containing protein [Candidatus Auribacterota bacterium]